MNRIALIGGSGPAGTDFLEGVIIEDIDTPWGKPSCEILRGRVGELEVIYLSRHGRKIRKPPHMINYRANIWALAQYKPQAVVALASVGAVLEDDRPGDLAIPDQILDYTWGRETSYNTGETSEINFIDFTNPFTESVRMKLLEAAEDLEMAIIDGGTYAVTQGPRLETAAEVGRLARDGAHYVGMTLMPEAALARELKLPYAALCQIVNPAAGIGDSTDAIDTEAMKEVLEDACQRSLQIVFKAFGA